MLRTRCFALAIVGFISFTMFADAQGDDIKMVLRKAIDAHGGDLLDKYNAGSSKFKGKITLADVMPPNEYRLIFEGQGGVAGFAKGEAHVALAPDGQSTQLSYTAKATIGGKLAQVGSRLGDGVAKKTAAAFFESFNRHLSGR